MIIVAKQDVVIMADGVLNRKAWEKLKSPPGWRKLRLSREGNAKTKVRFTCDTALHHPRTLEEWEETQALLSLLISQS